MTVQSNRILSDLPSGDPALLNRISWARRWNDRASSFDYALAARKKALDGHGRRSRAEQGFALRTMGWHALWRGDLTLAMDYCLRAETYLPESEFVHERAGIYSMLGKVHYMRNRFDLAICSVERGLWLVQEADEDAATLSDLMLTQAAIQRQSGERARAGITLGRARELSDGENAILVDICTAGLLLDDGDATRARVHAEAAVAAVERSGNTIAKPHAHAVMAGCMVILGKHLDAHDQIASGLDGLDKDSDMLARCALLRRRAELMRAKGDVDQTIAVLAKAADIAREGRYQLLHKKIALASADALEEKGDYKGAVAQHKIAWQLQSETRVR